MAWIRTASCSAIAQRCAVGIAARLTAQFGNVFTYTMLGRKMTVALGPAGTNFILNGKIAHVSAEEAYTHLTTPVFGTDVVYDVPNPILMEQKKFVKVGLSTDHFRRYVDLIRHEVLSYLDVEVFAGGSKSAVTADAFKTSSEITILTASSSLQGKEVRAGMDKSFAGLYHDRASGRRSTALIRQSTAASPRSTSPSRTCRCRATAGGIGRSWRCGASTSTSSTGGGRARASRRTTCCRRCRGRRTRTGGRCRTRRSRTS